MRSYVISDNIDALIGMRLAGIKGEVVHNREEVVDVLKEILKDKEIGIVIITKKVQEIAKEEIMDIKVNREYPLIVEIPGKKEEKIEDDILKVVRESIGVKI